jgi:hypothetical protein
MIGSHATRLPFLPYVPGARTGLFGGVHEPGSSFEGMSVSSRLRIVVACIENIGCLHVKRCYEVMVWVLIVGLPGTSQGEPREHYIPKRRCSRRQCDVE